MSAIDIVVLAAGKGTRMKSGIPKVLHRLAGRPLLGHVLHTAARLDVRTAVVVTGHGAEQVEAAGSALGAAAGLHDLRFARQQPQLGTGHAVQQAMPMLSAGGSVVVLSGDVPLIAPETVRLLADRAGNERLALLTVTLEDPTGYGRVVRDSAGRVVRIVEQKDASPAERAITEIYSGIMAAPARLLRGWLAQLSCDNAQGEYYLTDVAGIAAAAGVEVITYRTSDPLEVAGVNSPLQLATLERAWQLRQAHAVMEQGVRLADPARFELRDDERSRSTGELVCAEDVEIDVGCIFTGRVQLGAGVRVGAYCCIANARVEAGAEIFPYTHVDGEQKGVHIGPGARVGPWARLRPGASLGPDVHVGNFVEVKNSTLAAGAKANHLAYLGDASVGERVNYGAGSITANYDGANKHRTVIESDVHVGSNSVLVAPLTVGAGGTIGAGSVVTQDTAAGALTLVRGRQLSITDWSRPGQKTDH